MVIIRLSATVHTYAVQSLSIFVIVGLCISLFLHMTLYVQYFVSSCTVYVRVEFMYACVVMYAFMSFLVVLGIVFCIMKDKLSRKDD